MAMTTSWVVLGVVTLVAIQASASECSLGAWNWGPSSLGCCGCPKTTCCTTYPQQCGCGVPKTTCCSTSYGCPRSACCSTLPSCYGGVPSCGLPCGYQPCCLQSCGCSLPKTTTCTTIPFGNPICGKTTTCTTYPNPCGKSTTTCTTVPHANPGCPKTTTCQTLPLDPCCNPCASLCGKTCCSSFPGVKNCGNCGNPLCNCGYCTCPSPCQCGLF